MVAMFLRNNKRILVGLNAVLIVAALATVLYAMMPVESSTGDKPGVADKTGKNRQKEPAKQATAKNYSGIYARPLRESLIPSSPATTAVAAVATKTLNIKLLGTVIESDHRYGLFMGPDGKQKLVRSGEKFDKAKILRVNEHSATLDYHGKSIVLKVIKLPPLPSGNKKPRRSDPVQRRHPATRQPAASTRGRRQ